MTRRNRLADAKSPYLREAADQPVDWHPWSEEAFAKAKRENKPVLLDIGAQWCHWCHVIDQESYADPALAELINEHYVAIKVDRDERPDVDARYQRMVQAMTGQGGWPLTAFLTPDGGAFFGGTYFPPQDYQNRPGFRTVLSHVANFWRDRQGEAVGHAEKLRAALKERTRAQDVGGSDAFAQTTLRHIEQSFDPENGGFGTKPKFPQSGAIELALRHLDAAPRDVLRTVVTTTLRKMGDGGMYDQLEGGFHRYSVDEIWRVPHFEKLLYDNAELLRNYAHAQQVLGGDAPWITVKTRHLSDFVLRVLSDPGEPGFFASQDADVEPETPGVKTQREIDDGDYFTWTLDEMREALDGDERLVEVAVHHFGVRERGDMHHDPKRNVLHIARPARDIAESLGRTADDVDAAIIEARDRLLAARLRRTVPLIDRNLYANWNGMMASAMLETSAALADDALTERAVAALARFATDAWDDERGFAHLISEGSRGPGVGEHHGFLDDQAQMAWAMLDAWSMTGDPVWRDRVKATLDLVLKHYVGADGAVHDVAPALHEGGVQLLVDDRDVPVWDSPTPGAAAVLIRALNRYGIATADPSYTDAAKRLLEACILHARPGIFAATLALAAEEVANPPPHVVVVGSMDDARTQVLLAAARQKFGPAKVVEHVEPDASKDRLPDAVRGMMESRSAGSDPAAFVCFGSRCLAPVSEPEDISFRA